MHSIVGISHHVGALDTFVRASSVTGRKDREWLAGAESQQRVCLPSGTEQLEMAGTGDLVGEEPYEPVALVEVAVAVVAFEVVAVLRKLAAVSRYFVHVVAPCIAHGRAKTVPTLHPQ